MIDYDNLVNLPNKIYLRCPLITDFTEITDEKISLNNILISLKNPEEVASLLKVLLLKPGILIYASNLLNLMLYLKRHISSLLFNSFKNLNVINVTEVERYLGIEKDTPNSVEECEERLAVMRGWEEYHDKVITPLVLYIIPEMCNNGLLSTEVRKILYCVYIVEGQKNGRLKCNLPDGDKYFNPHSMSDEVKSSLRPIDNNLVVNYDYNHMEVSILAWLCKDNRLISIIHSGKDFYKELYFLLSQKEANEDNRKFMKAIFLPVIYGLGLSNLSKIIRGTEDKARNLMIKLKELFPTCFEYLKNKQLELKKTRGWANNGFGKRRKFEEGDYYKISDFLIQSVAAKICLEKLVELRKNLKPKSYLLASVHDGYYISIPQNNFKEMIVDYKNILENSNYDDLRLQTTCSIGTNMNCTNLLKF